MNIFLPPPSSKPISLLDLTVRPDRSEHLRRSQRSVTAGHIRLHLSGRQWEQVPDLYPVEPFTLSSPFVVRRRLRPGFQRRRTSDRRLVGEVSTRVSGKNFPYLTVERHRWRILRVMIVIMSIKYMNIVIEVDWLLFYLRLMKRILEYQLRPGVIFLIGHRIRIESRLIVVRRHLHK